MRSTVEQSLHKISRNADTIDAVACFSPAAPIFQGHFPGRPIVPAVYQMALCRMAVEKYYPGTFIKVVRSRFSVACVPDVIYNVKISLEENGGSRSATCSLKQGEVMHSKIVLLYGTKATPG